MTEASIKPWNPDLVQKAWGFASLHHRGQTYGGPIDGERIEYLNHIGSVAMEIMWALQTDTETNGDFAIQCAILHDTIEDTHVKYEMVNTEFGEKVANGVLALSKNPNLPTKEEQIRDSLKRIQQQPREVWMVKLADRINNLSSPPFYWDNQKILSYRDEAQIIYSELQSASVPLAERLKERIEAFPQFLKR